MISYYKKDMEEIRDIGYKQGQKDLFNDILKFIVLMLIFGIISLIML